MSDERTGIEEIRAAVRLFSLCRESFNQQYTAEQLLKIARASRACEWDMTPDEFTEEQIRDALNGKPLRFFAEGDRVIHLESKRGRVIDVDCNVVRVHWDGDNGDCSNVHASFLREERRPRTRGRAAR